ncbi:KdsC family phosphatase [Magnetococcales bacterium HHB-1]
MEKLISLPKHAEKINTVILDVDGVLTDGGIYLGDQVEIKRFFVRDGLGIRLLLDQGFYVALITARRSSLVEKRAEELKITALRQGVKDKWLCLKELLSLWERETWQCAYMGDDLIDLEVMHHVGLATAPADAAQEVKDQAHWTSDYPGGRGAVRQLAEQLLKKQNRWLKAIAPFYPATLKDATP